MSSIRQKIKICYFSATATELSMVNSAFKKLVESNKISVELIARASFNLCEDRDVEEFAGHVESADITIISLMGGKKSCPGFDSYVKAAKRLHIKFGTLQEDIELSRECSTDFGSEEFSTRLKYIKNSGVDNFYNLFLFCFKQIIGSKDLLVAEPVSVVHEGIYYSQAQKCFNNTQEYLSWYKDKCNIRDERSVVGIWIYQMLWLSGNLTHIDAFIKEIEAQRCIPLCVFSRRAQDEYLKNMPADKVIDKFFKESGKTLIDVLLNPGAMSVSMLGKGFDKIQPSLDVPVLQVICTQNTYQKWNDTLKAVTPTDVSCSVAQPEFDGNLITVVAATREVEANDPLTGAAIKKYMPVAERITKIVNLAKKWAMLRYVSNKEKKVAIIFHHNPPRNDRLGCAVGLDTFQSVKLLIDTLKNEGYTIDKGYETGEALAHEMLNNLTNDSRWLPIEELARRAAGIVLPDEYEKWEHTIPDETATQQIKHWGNPPGEVFTHDNQYLINGLINGNIYIGLQPPRGFMENSAENLHNPELPPPHHYLAYYRWIKYVFKADAIIHVGKHGSLEWLPGKSLGLSNTCFPDASIQDIPNIYPYIINDPGEGVQAKRRSYCCIIDHLTPPFVTADKSEKLAILDNLLSEYLLINSRQDIGKIPIIKQNIIEEIKKQKLETDLHLDLNSDDDEIDEIVKKCHAYIGEVADTIINDGLHTLGCLPREESFLEFVANMTRLRNGDVPSLRDEVLKLAGYDYLELCQRRGEIINDGKSGARIIEEGHARVLSILNKLESEEWNKKKLREIITAVTGNCNVEILNVLEYVIDTLIPNILRTVEESDAVVNALDGRFISPGPSGALTRGRTDILPTGRNFYSVDPFKVPTKEAWEIGKSLGDELVKRYKQDHGKHPETLGIIIWASPTMRTEGDDIAEVLYLMGIRPRWNTYSNRVEGLEIIPQEELKFPRIDVTLRTSGIFRDAFPNLMYLVDEAVKMVVALEESYDTNFLKRNVEREASEFQKKGESIEESLRLASFRVFSTRPGCYGAGVNKTLDAKQWKDKGDLAEIYVSWGGYAYAKKSYGKEVKDVFRKRLGAMNMTVKNEDSREYDMLSGDDFNSFHGGMNAAVTHFSGKDACSYTGLSADPRQVQTRSSQEEAKFVFRVRVLNPKWIEGMKRHGYKGAGDLSRQVDICFQWDATSDVVDDWMYENLAQTYALDKEMQEWFKEHNSYALNNITERLLEAIQRGMWNADEQMKKNLQNLYLKNEGDIEEALDDSGAVVEA